MSKSGMQEEACEETEKEKRSSLYVFPSTMASNVTTALTASTSSSEAQHQEPQVVETHRSMDFAGQGNDRKMLI